VIPRMYRDMEVSPGCAVGRDFLAAGRMVGGNTSRQLLRTGPPSFYDAWKSWFNVKTSWRCVE
jgi:hypothetical protein